MTPEEKQLLLVDLCARQPYGVKISVDDDNLFIPRLKYIDGLICHFYECAWTKYFDEIKPYLRSPENLNDEEKDYWHKLQRGLKLGGNIDFMIDFYHSHYIDYRGLIPMGIALEAPKNMYNN